MTLLLCILINLSISSLDLSHEFEPEVSEVKAPPKEIDNQALHRVIISLKVNIQSLHILLQEKDLEIKQVTFGVPKIVNNDSLVKFYTDFPNYATFVALWVWLWLWLSYLN